MYIKPSNDMDFWDLRDNQNHYIHMIRSWIIPRSHVLFEISKDLLIPIYQYLVGLALLLDSKSLKNNIRPGTFARYISTLIAQR